MAPKKRKAAARHWKFEHRCCYYTRAPLTAGVEQREGCGARAWFTESEDNKVLNWNDIPAEGLPDGYLARTGYSGLRCFCNKHIMKCSQCGEWTPKLYYNEEYDICSDDECLESAQHSYVMK